MPAKPKRSSPYKPLPLPTEEALLINQIETYVHLYAYPSTDKVEMIQNAIRDYRKGIKYKPPKSNDSMEKSYD